MRRALIVVHILLFGAVVTSPALALGKTTTDPNSAARVAESKDAAKDARLDQTITYRVKLRPIADLTDDLTALTGVTFFAGRANSDWRVREDCATVMAKDVTLGSLMKSIAHVMKFQWLRRGKSPNWTYRLVEDRSAIAEVERRIAKQKERGTRERLECWDRLKKIPAMSQDELARLKESYPNLYLEFKAGILGPAIEFLQQAPELRDAWLAGGGFSVAAAWLPQSARQSLMQVLRADLQLNASRYEPTDYYAQQLRDLDNIGRTMTVLVHDASPWGTVSPLRVMWSDATSVALDGTIYESDRLRQRSLLKAYEEQRPLREVFSEEVRGQITALQEKEQSEVCIISFSQEPIIDHPDDPALAAGLKKKVASKTITGLISDLADACGFAIVTDDFRGRPWMTFDEGTQLRHALDEIGKSRRYGNWNRNDKIIELWDVNWHDKRQVRVSKAWLETLRRKLRDTGTLDIDDLAEIAKLTNDQICRNISRDGILKCVADRVWFQRGWLKIYASMTPAQRAVLLSDAGLAYSDLTAEQQKAVMRIFLGSNAQSLQGLDLTAVGARVLCTKESRGKRFVYTIKARTELGDFPDQCIFSTPLYVPPPKPQDAKPAPPAR